MKIPGSDNQGNQNEVNTQQFKDQYYMVVHYGYSRISDGNSIK